MPPYQVGGSGVHTGELMSLVERLSHISYPELTAAMFEVRDLSQDKDNSQILGNQTAVLYINRMGGNSLPPAEQSGCSTMGMVPGKGNNRSTYQVWRTT